MKKLFSFLLIVVLIACSKDPVIYTLTATANPTEGGSVSPSSQQYDSGDVATVTATPSAEYVFQSWSGSASGSSPSTTVTMDSDKAVVANFVKKKYALTVKTEGEGSVTEKVIKAGVATDYNSGTVVELTAVPEGEWLFVEWTGDLTGSENPKEITIDKAKTVTAVFVKKQYPLTIEIEGEGTVSEKVIKQGLATDYNSGTIVELTAEPTGDWEFVEWSGDITSTENPVQITINESKKVKVKFKSKDFFVEIPNAFPNLTSIFESIGGANSTIVTSGDLNKDGYVDILIHIWHALNYQVTTSPTKNKLIALLNNGDNTYRNGTRELFGSDNIELFGASRKVDSADLNCDGYPDFVYALNKEDGRDGNGNYWWASNAAIVSDGNGGYNILEIDPQNPNYSHSVEIVREGNCNFVIIFDGSQDYRFSGSEFIPLNNNYIDDPSYRRRAIGTFLSYDENGDGVDDVIVHDTQNEDGWWLLPYLTVYRNNGNWTKIGEFRWKNSFQIVEGDGNGNFQRNNAVIDNDITYISGGFFTSLSIDIDNSSRPIPVVRFGTSRLLTGSIKEGDTIYPSSNRVAWNRLLALEITNSSVQEKYIFNNESVEGNVNIKEELDFDMDGFQDLVLFPYRDGGNPIILQNSSGTFYINDYSNIMPDISDPLFDTTLILDVNNDGINDIIYRRAHGCGLGWSNGKCGDYKLLLGNRKIN
jgi:hypothetical protein